MRVEVWPADESGCGHYRLIFAARALAAQGADVTITSSGPTVIWDRRWAGAAPPLDAQVIGVEKPAADVVVMQRPGRAHWTHIIPHLQAHGVRVIVDVDDDFHAIPRANVAAAEYDPQVNALHNREWISRACDLADMVTVTTPALAARYGGHGRVRVLPNLIPASYLNVPPAGGGGRTVGWTGSVETHPHDLEVTGGGVHRALTVTGARFRVVGTGTGVAERLGVPRVEALGAWAPFWAYPVEVAKLDVGIVPLHPCAFNDAKSALKAGEMAAVGVVPVVSPTPDNLRLHRLGVGLLAEKPQQWKKQIVRLILDPQRRADLAGQGREVMAGLTYEQHCGDWWTAWTDQARVRAAA